MVWEPFILSFKLATLTTLILFILALPFAWWLSQTQTKVKPLLEALTALPLVLPPSVLGFYLLLLFAPDSWFGEWVRDTFGLSLVFHFSGLVIASCFYSLPFMVQPLQNGFEALKKEMIESSFLAGKGSLQTLWYIALPNSKPALMTALILTFAHTVGEFGIVLMIGGSIPSETKVASVAIYEMVEMMEYTQAHLYSALLVGMSFLVLLFVYTLNRHLRVGRV